MLTVRLPKKLEARLAVLTEKTGRSKTFYVREAIVEHLQDLEDFYLSEQLIKQVRAGRLKTIPLKAVMKRYGLEA